VRDASPNFKRLNQMSDYDILLQQARLMVEGLRKTIRSTAKEFIPKMYFALKEEDSKMSTEDARQRIQKDCTGIWSRRTILGALPDEAKDPEKQKAGRLRQKNNDSAALSAAPLNKEIIIDTQGRPIMDVPYLLEDPTANKRKHQGSELKECISCRNLLIENKELKEALSKSTTLTRAVKIPQCTSYSPQNEYTFHFEFCISLEDIRKYIANLNLNDCWFNATIDTREGKVICASIGRSTQTEAVNRLC